MPRILKWIHFSTLLFILSPTLMAETSISGDIFDGNGGPLIDGEVYHVIGAISVPAGETLTVQGGAIVKFGAADILIVSGTLVVAGSAGNPAIFTSLSDDSAGGDTNDDGPSDGAPGHWTNLTFNPDSDASQISGAEIRFAGTNGFSAIQLIQADITITDTLVRDGAGAALALNGDSRPSVLGCEFKDCLQAVTGVRLDGVPLFFDNEASGNPNGDYMLVTQADIATDITVNPDNILEGALVFANNIGVPLGRTLTLDPGTVFKFRFGNLHFSVDGTLITQGTALDPVVLTSLTDDEHGGDTNGDGPSSGTAGQWSRLQFTETADDSRLVGTHVRFAGFGGFPGVDLFEADIEMTECRVFSAFSMGLFLGNGSFPTVRDCAFDNNNLPITGLTWPAVQGFLCNSATDNITGDYMSISPGRTFGTATVRPENYPGPVIVCLGGVAPSLGDSLTLEKGVVLKVGNGAFVQAGPEGALNILGSGLSPVVITTIDDDEVGGDTNKNGDATTPYPGQWAQMHYVGEASASTVHHLTLRHGGWGGYSGFNSSSALLDARAIRVELAWGPGFSIHDLAFDLRDCVAIGCGGNGFEMRGSSRDLVHGTAYANGGYGVASIGPFDGQVRNVISWGNTNGAYSGFIVDDVFYSNGDSGFAGSNGNIFSDPLFEDVLEGDLRLSATSPCIETGDPADQPERGDAYGFPRSLDGDLDRVRRVDMGAHEFDHVTLSVEGDLDIGSTITFESTGTPGTSALMFLGFGIGAQGVNPYGTLFLNLGLPFFLLEWPAVPSVLPIVLPPEVGGLTLTFQELSFIGTAGNFSNPATLDFSCSSSP